MWTRMVVASLVARRLRLALSLVSVALGVGVATALVSLALRVGDDLARTLRAAGPNFVIEPRAAGPSATDDERGSPSHAGSWLESSTVSSLKHTFWKNNVLAAAPELDCRARIQGESAILTGTWYRHEVPQAPEPWTTGLAELHSSWRLEGRWPADDADELVLTRDRAAALGIAVGSPATVDVGQGTERWLVTGLLDTDGPSDGWAWTSLRRAQQASLRWGQADRVWLSVLVRPAPRGPAPDPERNPAEYERYRCSAFPENVARGLEEHFSGLVVVRLITERVAGEAAVVSRLNLLLVLLALAALTASALGVFSTTTMMVVERQIELGMLRALGAGEGTIAMLLLAETIIVAVLGGAIGFGLGVAGAAAIRGESFGGPIDAPALLLPFAIALSAAVALAGTLGPLRLALRVDPAKALRG